MRLIFWSRPVMTEETHRITHVEIFFDLVFIFAFTRVTAFMGRPPTPITLVQGLILLLLLWMSWTTYTWLGNQARADVGPIYGGFLAASAATFVIALVIPDAWQQGNGTVDGPLTLALAYIVLRALDVGLYFYAAAQSRQMRTTLRLFSTTTAFAWIPLILGATLGGTAQTLLWALAVVIDFGGGLIASKLSGWELRSPSHFAERHSLVMIIALGESLISVGVGAGAGMAVTRGPVLLAALLTFVITLCGWWFYFRRSAVRAAEILGRTPSRQRGAVASNAYSLAHFPMTAGIIFVALGAEQVLAHLVHDQPGHPAGPPLEWTSTAALYGGAALYLIGRSLFRRLSVGAAPTAHLVAAAMALVLLPVARFLPALAALGLLTAFLVTLLSFSLRVPGRQQRQIQHGPAEPDDPPRGT
ncbi:low temperature requirement protein A [Micromonospora sp. IBHARD004]|uniref:low temperature requirement protein A n=1 Tax=Micromonospora sp. IBHARD004 TaxID=3457764 RepID=UPI004058E533